MPYPLVVITLPYFPNVNLELWDYTESQDQFNTYYEPVREYALCGVYPANFQPMSSSDSLKEFGEVLTDTYKVNLDHAVPVNPRMLVRIVGEEDTYEIVGTPMRNTRFISTRHVKIIVKKQRKPTKLSPVSDSV